MPKFHSVITRLALSFAFIVWLGAATSLDGGGFSVVAEHMTDAEARDVFARARDGHAAVTRYLKLQPAQKIVIKDVDADTSNGRTTITMSQGKTEAIAPIQIQIPLHYLRKKPFKTAIVHELTHAVAGIPFEGNAFLAEGLAVHVNGVLARTDESDSFANFPIHELAHRHLRRIVILNPIQHLFASNAIFTEQGKTHGSGYSQETGYVFAGSFVTFLVQRDAAEREHDALARFLRVYRHGNFAKVYGKPLATLEREWISYINKKPKARFAAGR